jgi:hypothetical protein
MKFERYLDKMFIEIKDEEKLFDKIMEIEDYMANITDDAYYQGSLSRSEWNYILSLLDRMTFLKQDIIGLLEKLKNYLETLEAQQTKMKRG